MARRVLWMRGGMVPAALAAVAVELEAMYRRRSARGGGGDSPMWIESTLYSVSGGRILLAVEARATRCQGSVVCTS